MKVLKFIFPVIATIFIFTSLLKAQSKDIAHPTILTSKAIQNLSNPADEDPVYYSFCVGAGKLKITSNIISADDGGCVLNLHFLDENQEEISMDNNKINDYWGYKKNETTNNEYVFQKTQKIILKITFNGNAKTAQFLLDGNIGLNNDCTGLNANSPTPPKNTPPKSTPKEKEKPKENNNSNLDEDPKQQDSNSSSTPSTQEGYITLNVSSTKIFSGGSITISGESGQMKTIKTVEIKIKGPQTAITKTLELTNGKYKTAWSADAETGDFIITATSSDGKATEQEKVEVYSIVKIETMANENIEETNNALNKMTAAIDNVKSKLSPNDASDLDKKFKAAKAKIDNLQNVYRSINAANKDAAKLMAGKIEMPGFYFTNLSELNDRMHSEVVRLKKISSLNNHKIYGLNICELLVIINETCQAFSAASNVAELPFSVVKCAAAIAVDKGVPYGADYVNSKSTKHNSDIKVDATKEIGKIYAAAAVTGTKFIESVTSAGFMGDIISFAMDILLKKYCVVFDGFVTQEHTAHFRNKKGQDWWAYSYKTQAKISLRYPKQGNEGNIVKMKGNIEGNATQFGFMQDINKEDDFSKELKGRSAGKYFIEMKPACLPYATSLNDKLGFGAVARAIATPACFNIPIDAEYKRDAATIKLFLNPAFIDFSRLVKTQVLYFDFVPFPLVTYQAFPYEKVFISMNSVVKRSKGYKMIKSATGNLSFINKDSFHVGSKKEAVEIDVKLNIAATQQ